MRPSGMTTRDGRLRGQSFVEMALALPFLLALAFLIADGSNLYRSQQAVETAASEASRYAVSNPSASVDDIGKAARAAVGLADLDVVVDAAGGGSSTTTASELKPFKDPVTGAISWKVVSSPVTTTYTTRKVTVSRAVPIFGGNSLTVSASRSGISGREG